jgi:hypothetical protein
VNTHRLPRALLATGLLSSGLLAGAASAQYQTIKAFGENVATAGDHTGQSVAILGDCDGDGIDDWIVGAPNDGDGGVDSGTAYVLTGGYYSNILFEIHGGAGQNLGTRVCSAGDWDKDGRADFAVSAPGYDTIVPFSQDRGIVRVYSGKTGLVLGSFIGPKTGARFGEALDAGGDVTADGWPDIIIGAPSWDADPASSQTTNEGYVALYNGKTGALLKSFTGETSSLLGAAVCLVDELDVDHSWDYAIGSPSYSYISGGPFPLLQLDAGRVQVYSGATHTLLYSKLGGLNDALGSALANVEDTDGDFVRELLVGAPGDGGDGRAFLYEGPTGTLLHTYTAAGYGSPEGFGSAVGPLGDVNKDGYDDVAIGAPMSTASTYGGYVEVFSGKDGSLVVPLLNGPYPGVLAGAALSPSIGDLNGDDWPDLLMSWPWSDYDGTDSGLALGLGFLSYQPDLGFEGPGTAQLSCYGTELFSGGQADMKLAYAAPSSPAYLLASLSQVFASFKGGILVPDAGAGQFFAFNTNTAGSLVLPGIPGGGGYAIVYCQFLIKSASYPQGWGLSNALAVELLP